MQARDESSDRDHAVACHAIRNLTRDAELHPAPEFATTLLAQIRGFMFRRPGNSSLIFQFPTPREIVLHTFFVHGPLDVLVLDFEHRVVASISNLIPYRIWNSGIRARLVVELPAGTLERTGTKIGDRLVLPQYDLQRVAST